MQPQPIIYITQDDVDNKLAQLGLTAGVIRDALASAHMYAAECTEFDPPMAAGFIHWAKASRFLREQLVPAGWRACNEKLITVDNEKLGISLVVGGGDDATADPDRSPSTKYQRGAASVFAIDSNEALVFDLPFFHEMKAAQDAKRRPRGLQTWWLLVHRTKTGARCEVSLPVKAENGHIKLWQERIILGEFDFGLGVDTPDLPSFDSGPGIDIEVKSRAV